MAGYVYVLGAGFSHGFNNEMFPLVRNFLPLAKANNFYDPEGKHHQLASIIATYFGDPLYYDIEKVLSFLSAHPFYYRTIPYEHRSVAYDELVELISLSLSKALQEPSVSSETAHAYRKFVQHLTDTESTVITFNYDLLLEKLLIETTSWQPNYGYGVHIPLTYEAMPTSPHTYLHQQLSEYTDMRWHKVTLLKMHGSINWGTPTFVADKSEDIFQAPVKDGIPESELAIKTDYGAPFTLQFKPVIVPPVLDKSSWLQNRSFRVIWNMAMEAVAEADQITFIGYSLPTTDFMAEFMFRQGINLITKERKVTVVDPCPTDELKRRYKSIFDLPGLVTFLSFKKCNVVEYVNEVLCLNS
jgi:hypothetical protein